MPIRGPSEVTIVGAGLGGTLLATFLGRRGRRVTLLEQRPDPRAQGFVVGRSINLALSARGIDALRRVGLADRILADAIAMTGRMIHSPAGALTFQAYSKNNADAIHSVSRAGLNLALIDAADDMDEVSIHFDQRCVDVDIRRGVVVSERRDSADPNAPPEHRRWPAKLIVGADGAFSRVRLSMQFRPGFDVSQSYLSCGYKELHIPPADQCGVDPTRYDGFAMEPHALHIWPRGGAMMIALPNADKSFTCTLFWPFHGPHSFDDASHVGVRTFFQREYRDVLGLMPSLVDDFDRNPVSSLVTIRTSPWHLDDRVVLMGDAAHAVVPFYGQGMNASFEDCVSLSHCLDKHASQSDALRAYYSERKIHADAIADLAIANFYEMRDKVASPRFLLWKKTERTLHALLGRRYTPCTTSSPSPPSPTSSPADAPVGPAPSSLPSPSCWRCGSCSPCSSCSPWPTGSSPSSSPLPPSPAPWPWQASQVRGVKSEYPDSESGVV